MAVALYAEIYAPGKKLQLTPKISAPIHTPLIYGYPKYFFKIVHDFKLRHYPTFLRIDLGTDDG